MADTQDRTQELERQVAQLERVIQNLQQRFGQQVAQYETQLALFAAQLQQGEEEQAARETEKSDAKPAK